MAGGFPFGKKKSKSKGKKGSKPFGKPPALKGGGRY